MKTFTEAIVKGHISKKEQEQINPELLKLNSTTCYNIIYNKIVIRKWSPDTISDINKNCKIKFDDVLLFIQKLLKELNNKQFFNNVTIAYSHKRFFTVGLLIRDINDRSNIRKDILYNNDNKEWELLIRKDNKEISRISYKLDKELFFEKLKK